MPHAQPELLHHVFPVSWHAAAFGRGTTTVSWRRGPEHRFWSTDVSRIEL